MLQIFLPFSLQRLLLNCGSNDKVVGDKSKEKKESRLGKVGCNFSVFFAVRPESTLSLHIEQGAGCQPQLMRFIASSASVLLAFWMKNGLGVESQIAVF